MKKYLFIFAMVIVALLVFAGCSKNFSDEKITHDDNSEIVGTMQFVSSLKCFELPTTKSGELSDEDILLLEQAIAPIFPLAINYLKMNGYDYTQDFEDGDPNIILTAYGLAECDYIVSQQTKSFWDDAAAVGSCVLFGADVYALAKLGAKAIAKKIIKKALPYVGTVLGAAEATACIIGYFD